MRKLYVIMATMLLCGVIYASFDGDVIWITRVEGEAGVAFRVEAPVISFDGSYPDPEAGVASLFSTLKEASAEISNREASIAAAEAKIERLQSEIEWMQEEIMDLSEMAVASEMLAGHEEMVVKCARIMNGKDLSGWLKALVDKHGPVVQSSVGQNSKGNVVPSFAWWLWRK